MKIYCDFSVDGGRGHSVIFHAAAKSNYFTSSAVGAPPVAPDKHLESSTQKLSDAQINAICTTEKSKASRYRWVKYDSGGNKEQMYFKLAPGTAYCTTCLLKKSCWSGSGTEQWSGPYGGGGTDYGLANRDWSMTNKQWCCPSLVSGKLENCNTGTDSDHSGTVTMRHSSGTYYDVTTYRFFFSFDIVTLRHCVCFLMVSAYSILRFVGEAIVGTSMEGALRAEMRS